MRDTFDPKRIERDRKELLAKKRQVWNAMPNEAQENISELIREFYGDSKPKSIHLKAGDLEYRKRGGLK